MAVEPPTQSSLWGAAERSYTGEGEPRAEVLVLRVRGSGDQRGEGEEEEDDCPVHPADRF